MGVKIRLTRWNIFACVHLNCEVNNYCSLQIGSVYWKLRVEGCSEMDNLLFCQADIFSRRDDLCRLNGIKGFSLKLNVGHKIKCPGHPRMNTALIRSDCKAILMFTRTHRGRVSNDIKIKFQRACLKHFRPWNSLVLLPNIFYPIAS